MSEFSLRVFFWAFHGNAELLQSFPEAKSDMPRTKRNESGKGKR